MQRWVTYLGNMAVQISRVESEAVKAGRAPRQRALPPQAVALRGRELSRLLAPLAALLVAVVVGALLDAAASTMALQR